MTIEEHVWLIASPGVASALTSVFYEPLTIEQIIAVYVLGLPILYGARLVRRRAGCETKRSNSL